MAENNTPSTVRDLKSQEVGATGRAFSALLLVRKVTSKTAANGNSYLSVELGDRSGSFNISSACGLIVAAAGVPVLKHGNRSITSKSGSADFLAGLGVTLEATDAQLLRGLEQARWLVYGALLLLTIILAPEGLIGTAERWLGGKQSRGVSPPSSGGSKPPQHHWPAQVLRRGGGGGRGDAALRGAVAAGRLGGERGLGAVAGA